MITFYDAVADTGGALGSELTSGTVGELLPEVTKANQLAGVTIYRKFYLVNDVASAIPVILTIGTPSAFTAIVFESGGDSEVVGDLSGSETNESPITVDVPSAGHTSFWLKIVVASSSTETINYNTIDIDLAY